MQPIQIVVADITAIEVDAIVNAANKSLLGGGGVDGAIHQAGGLEILKECRLLRQRQYPEGLPTGEAVMTTGGNLKAKYVIHTVGPIYHSDKNPEESLRLCYKNALLLAEHHQCTSIAFPAISTGVYGYPKVEAARIAYETVASTLKACQYVKEVLFVFSSENNAMIFRSALKR